MNTKTKENCCGCSACADVCPTDAIIMRRDAEGFVYPQIDAERCIDCGKCEQACGFRDDYCRDGFYAEPQAFGLKHKRLQTRLHSRSGAAFVGISDWVLAQGGAVYGACMTAPAEVAHIRAVTARERDAMCKAKYVQSDTVGLYPRVAEDLKNGMAVLFSGTPCQVSSLRSYLKCLRVTDEKLLCCDLVCHGVPSPAFWKRYLAHVEQKTNSRVQTAEFRDKSFGWDTHFESFVMESGQKIVSRDYTDLFYEHLLFRPSCHHCKFANGKRVGDLTLADFWGIEKNSRDFDDNRGVSLLLVNNDKGSAVFEAIRDTFEVLPCDFRNCLQPTLIAPSEPSPERAAFWRDYQTMRFDRLLKKYTRPKSVKGRAKKLVKKTLFRLKIRNHP